MCEDATLWNFFVGGPGDRMLMGGRLTGIELKKVLSRVGVIMDDCFLRARWCWRAWQGVVEEDKEGGDGEEANPRATVTKKLIHTKPKLK
jgi:hypothetical protein